MIDYEQKYFDLLYENKKLNEKIKILEDELFLYKKTKNIDIHKEIIKELNDFYRRKKMQKEEILQKLAFLYRAPKIFDWRNNGTSEDFIRGYHIALEKVVQELNIEIKQFIEEINKQ